MSGTTTGSDTPASPERVDTAVGNRVERRYGRRYATGVSTAPGASHGDLGEAGTSRKDGEHAALSQRPLDALPDATDQATERIKIQPKTAKLQGNACHRLPRLRGVPDRD